jgi:hypothetical protein
MGVSDRCLGLVAIVGTGYIKTSTHFLLDPSNHYLFFVFLQKELDADSWRGLKNRSVRTNVIPWAEVSQNTPKSNTCVS